MCICVYVCIYRSYNTEADFLAKAAVQDEPQSFHQAYLGHQCPWCRKDCKAPADGLNALRSDAQDGEGQFSARHPLRVLQRLLESEVRNDAGTWLRMAVQRNEKFPPEACKRKFCEADVPLCCKKRKFEVPNVDLESASRTAKFRKAKLSTSLCDIDMPCLPKEKLVDQPSKLRPISLIPLLRKLLGGLLMNISADSLVLDAQWQFAYRPGFQMLEVPFLVNLCFQKSIEWRLPLFFASIDIPRAFDELSHELLFIVLLSRGVNPAFVAWFIRELRCCRLYPRFQSFTSAPISLTRGVPQGSTWGPLFFILCLAHVLHPVWESCQVGGLGFQLESGFLPFVVYSDNIYVLAHSLKDFQKIYKRIREALEKVKWRLPPERITWTGNSFCEDFHNPWEDSILKGAGETIRVLGVLLSINGSTAADFTQKRAVAISTCERRKDLWCCKSSTRKQRYKLMYELFMSQLWSSPLWTIRGEDCAAIRGALRGCFRRHLRLAGIHGESAERFARRQNKCIREVRKSLNLWEPDAIMCTRVYNFAGHVARISQFDSTRLTAKVLRHKDRGWCRQLLENFGHAGHPGRFAPWNYEFQLDRYFRHQGLEWTDIAADRGAWAKERKGWVQAFVGRSEL